NDTYTVTLSRLDSNFIRSEVAQAVVVENTPPVNGEASESNLPVLDTRTSDVTVSNRGKPDNPSLNCVWDFGDGQTESISNCKNSNVDVSHDYLTTGVYTATLTATDKDGGATSAAHRVTVRRRETRLAIFRVQSISETEAEVKLAL